MSDNNFEVAFSGEIAAGADLNQVKAKVAALFKTDVAKIEHMFSGARVVIKKGLDSATAQKYQTAMKSAGAICEIRNNAVVATAPAPAAPTPQAAPKPSAPAPTKRTENSHAPAAPQTVPLSVTGADIAELKVEIAPIGSDMNQKKKQIQVQVADISGISMAPVGTELSSSKKAIPQPLPDTSGLSLEKN